jgi:O-antigen/teichoic acid export membrane protein
MRICCLGELKLIDAKYFFERLKNDDSALKQVFLVAGGSVIAQGFNMLVMPVLSRIYSPEDFGILAVFSSVMAITIPLSSLRYFLAVALPKAEKYSHSLVILSFFIQVTFLILMSILILVFGNCTLQYFGMQKLIPYKMLLPVAVFGASLYSLLVQWAIRKKLFGVIARTKISQSLSGGIVKIVLGLMQCRPLGLLVGNVIGQAGGILSVFKSLYDKNGLPRATQQDIRRVAIKYRKFPMFDTPAAMINVTGDQIIPILVFTFYGGTIAGYFSVAQQLLTIPSVFIGTAIGQVFLQRASVARYKGGLKELSLNTYELLLQLGVFPILLIAFFAPGIFSFVLGKQWLDAGYFARFLAPFVALSFAFSPISHLFNILARQGLSFALETLYFVVKIAAFFVGTLFNDPLLSVALFAIGGATMVLVRSYFILRISENETSSILYVIFRVLLRAISLISIIYISILLFSNYWIVILLFLCILVYIYQTYTMLLKLKLITIQ